MPGPDADVVVVVARRLAVKDSVARQFVDRCQQSSPECTAEDIVWSIGQVDATIDRRKVRNPTAILLENVPLQLPTHMQLRGVAREAQERATAAERARQAQRDAEEELERRFNAVLTAMPSDEWEGRVTVANAECKADKVRYPDWTSWRMTNQQRREQAETRARNTLRVELAEEKAEHG